MFYPKKIVGDFVYLQSITLDDAQFSYDIRADKKNRDTVGQLAKNLNDQIQFIKWQIKEPNDYYFVVFNKNNERIGLIGVYGICDGMGEVGREVNVGDPMEILEAEVLLHDFCKDVLGLNRICFVIYSNNVHHINEVKRKGAKLLKTVQRGGRNALYFEQDMNEDNEVNLKIRKMLARLSGKKRDS